MSDELRIHRAERFIERLGGLLVRPMLKPGEALSLSPCGSIHTCFMRYAIDVVFLDKQELIVKIVPRLAPWRAAGARGAHCTLELLAGEAARIGLVVGMQLPTSRLRP